ncbi:MAG: cache domain-containing protein, partial [Pseudanabaena sp.]
MRKKPMTTPILPTTTAKAVATGASINCESNGFKIPLIVLITLPFLLSTFGIVGLISWLTFRNAHEAIGNLNNQLHRKVTEQVQDQLNSYLELPYILNQINANDVDLDQLNGANEQRIQTLFWKELQDFPHISNIYVTNTSGQYIGARRIKNQFTVEDATAIYMADNLGRAKSPLMAKNRIKLSDRSWYQKLIETQQSTWSEVYTESMTGEAAITAIKPIYDPNGDFQGVLGVSMRLGDINRFLKETKVSQKGQTFIVDHAGRLVASSNLEATIATSNYQNSQY